MSLRRRLRNRTKKSRRRKYWVRPLFRAREEKGEFNIYNELRLHDREYLFRYFRMQPQRFDDLHSPIVHKISGDDTVFRKAIPSRERLAVHALLFTLRSL